MQSQALGHGIMGFVTLASLLWLDALPGEFILRAAELLLAWCALSTLLVACAGAWVALGRSRRAELPRPAPFKVQ